MSLRGTLERYVATAGKLGGGGATTNRITDRAALIDALRRDSASTQKVLAIWGAFAVATFVFLLAAASLHLADPKVVVPVGCLGFFFVLRRLEAVWRESRLLSMASQIAFLADDETMLREVMTLVSAALRAQT